MALELRFLGEMQISMGETALTGLKSSKGRALLCYLAVTGKKHSRSSLAGLFWSDVPEKNARANLRKTVSRIKPNLGSYLIITHDSIAFNRETPHWLDVAELEKGVKPGSETPCLIEAVSLYHGDFLDGYYLPDAPIFDEWVLVQRARLREAVLGGLKVLVEHFTIENDFQNAITYAKRLLDIEPWQEEAHRELMRLLALNGQRSVALIQYERCRQILVEELGVEPGEETTTLYYNIRDGEITTSNELLELAVIDKGDSADQEKNSGTSREQVQLPTNLPYQPTNFVGRERELLALQDLIITHRTRLVTLVGPGGIGKTRLAHEFAERLVRTQNSEEPSEGIVPEKFPDGVFFVSLESLNSKELIIPAVADAMRFRLDRGVSQLLGYLSSKQLLLILDNYEHLSDGVNFLSDIQKSAPGVFIMATSREPLRLLGEQVFPLKGLDFPTIETAKNVLDYPSGKLFLLAARRHQPDFDINDSELKYLARICLLTEGMPLALELATTWISSLPLSEIAAEIQKNFDFLSTDFRNIPYRHRSIRAVIDVSWEQLSPTQKKIFAGLSVFRGGFTRKACEEITGASFADIASLVEKSFLRYIKSQDRYSMHELLRQYGAEKLAGNSEELVAIQDHHSQYYCRWSWDQIRSENLLSMGQKFALDAMTLELENVRAAWIWALKNQRIRRIWNKVSVFGRYYIWRGGYQEGRRIFRTFADLINEGIEPSKPKAIYLQATIFNWLAFFLYELGDQSEVLELLQQSRALLNSPLMVNIDTRGEKAHNLVIIARTDWSLSDEERINLLAEARAFYREIGDIFGLSFALTFSGRLAILSGRLREAQQFIEESLKIYEVTGNQLGRAISLTGLGNLAFAENEYDRAVRLLQTSVDLARQIDSHERIVISRMYQGIVYLHSGKFNHAIHTFELCLADSKHLGFYQYQATSLFYLGYACLHLGSYVQSTRYADEARKLIGPTGDETIKYQSLMLIAAVALVNGSYQEALAGFEQVYRDRDIWRSGKFMFGEDPGKTGLGAALSQLGDKDKAQILFTNLLRLAVDTHRQDRLLYALVGFALLFTKQGDVERAIEHYSLAARHPFVGSSRWFSDTFGQPIEEASKGLPIENVTKSRSQGEKRDLWGTADELLLEFGNV